MTVDAGVTRAFATGTLDCDLLISCHELRRLQEDGYKLRF